MTTIVTRTGKGSPLTHVEVDTNFTNLNTAKLEAGAIALGSAAAPSISFTGDTNTGIYSPGADQVAISTNGTGRLFVDASGNVGIASGAIQSLGVNYSTLEIKGKSGGFGGGIILSPSDAATASAVWYYDGNCNFGSINSVPIVFLASGTERARLTSAGLFGLGTSSPGYLVTAATSADGVDGVSVESPSVNGIIRLRADGTNGNAIRVGGLGAQANTLRFLVASDAERMRIDSSGRLLVGGSTDSGGALLQVFDDRIRIGTAKTPASATATGTTGEIAWDANYIYVCTATNIWKRVAISTW